MTMPIGSDEEPSVTMVMEQSIPVDVVSSGRGNSAAEFGYWRTFTLTPTTAPVRIANRSLRRKRLLIKINASASTSSTPGTSASQSAAIAAGAGTATLPISGDSLSGFSFSLTATGTVETVTITNVVGGPLVYNFGAATSGQVTFPVPLVSTGAPIAVAFTSTGGTATGSIIAYYQTPSVAATQSVTDGVFVMGRDIANNVSAGPASVPFVLGQFQNGGYLQLNDNVRWEVQQELWVTPIPANTGTVYVTVSDEMFASNPMKSKRGRTSDDD